MTSPPAGDRPHPAEETRSTDPAESRSSDGSDVVHLSRIIDEIRNDVRWRERIADLDAEKAKGGDAAPQEPGDARPIREPLRLPELEPLPESGGIPAALVAACDTIEGAIEAADQVVPVEAGRPIVGELWARVRHQIQADVRRYQDRQTMVNRTIVAALLEVQKAIDPVSEGSPMRASSRTAQCLHAQIGSVIAALEQIERAAPLALVVDAIGRLDRLERRTDERLAALERTVDHQSQSISTVIGELVHLDRLRVRLADRPEFHDTK